MTLVSFLSCKSKLEMTVTISRQCKNMANVTMTRSENGNLLYFSTIVMLKRTAHFSFICSIATSFSFILYCLKVDEGITYQKHCTNIKLYSYRATISQNLKNLCKFHDRNSYSAMSNEQNRFSLHLH